ncbi:peptidase d [Stylonychia lemnae]|uniref:Xaa-Pro dipeptidase n=1 Tax=Stylonychia lemnae TaxID=5949 RepID=A0A078B0W2_STYLE|nr:peptidase d [Stylonychia lemnae]|eukprot:CDW86992.1 peptidase d [Stylonychia lemnae]
MVETSSVAKDFPYFESLPNSLFQDNRARFIKNVKAKLGESLAPNGVALFKGYTEILKYNSDCPYPFVQEGNFYYLFGVNLPDCYGIIDFKNEEATLFIPKLENIYKIWMTVPTVEFCEKRFDIKTRYIEDLPSYLAEKSPEKIYINSGINTDSGVANLLPEEKHYLGYGLDKDSIYNILADTRVYKSEAEIDALRWATVITVEGHVQFMRKCKPGMRESQIETLFKSYCEYNYYCDRISPYIAICGCGNGAATLHYNDNDKILKDGETILCDLAHAVHHYTSDITSSFPVNGKFTQKQREIYEIVLKASREVQSIMKPGASWVDMHLLAERIILTGLRDLGLVSGDIEEMIEGRVGYIFMPHGLGHLIGVEVHEVGGYLEGITPERRQGPGLKNLRTARVLDNGITITVEPGLYFRDFLLDGEFGDDLKIDIKYLNREKIREYQQEISGVRIEDVVLVTQDGIENFSSGLPRTVEEIEACMRGEEWRK